MKLSNIPLYVLIATWFANKRGKLRRGLTYDDPILEMQSHIRFLEAHLPDEDNWLTSIVRVYVTDLRRQIEWHQVHGVVAVGMFINEVKDVEDK
jgi:hypothetical protein